MKYRNIILPAILFMISLIIRASFFQGFLSHNHNYMVPEDSAQYKATANSLISGETIQTHSWAGKHHRLPGYPLFIALSYKLLGKNEQYALWAQIFIASSIPILIYFLVITLFPQSLITALFASFITALHPGFITYAGSLMSESLFIIFFLLFLLVFLPHVRPWFSKKTNKMKLSHLFYAGLLLGVAAIIRPVGTPLLLLSFFYLLWTHDTLKKKLQACGILFTGWLSICGWVLLRNYLACGALFFHTLPGIHFLRYSTASVYQEIHNCSFAQAREALAQEWEYQMQKKEYLKQEKLNEYERCVIAENITKQYFTQYPVVMLKYWIINIIKTTCGLHASYLQFVDTKELFEHKNSWGVWERIRIHFPPHVHSWFLIPIIYWEILLLGLILCGVLGFCMKALFNHMWFEYGWLTIPWVGLFIGLTLGAGCARLRLPADIFLLILASYFYTYMLFDSKRKEQ